MNRFFGMMPSEEIKKERIFEDPTGLRVAIQAGPNGYSVLYTDGNAQYKDIKASTDENFKTAYNIAKNNLGELIPVNSRSCGEC